MTRRTRVFVFLSLAVLATGLLVGGLLARFGAMVPGGAATALDQDLGAIPRDAVLVAHVDVPRVMASGLRRRLQDLIGSDAAEGRRTFERETGLDLERDIDTVTVAVLPAARGDAAGTGAPVVPAGADGVLLVRGRFDQARLEQAAVARGAVAAEHRGVRLLTAPDRDGRTGTMTIGFLAPAQVLLGSSAAVRRAIDAERAGSSLRQEPEALGRARAFAHDTGWMVARLDTADGARWLPAEMRAQLPGVTWLAAGGTLDGDLTGRVVADVRDEDAARNLRDMARGLVALGRLQAGRRPELRTLLESIQLGGDGRTVRLSARVPAELLASLGARGAGAPEDAPGAPASRGEPPASERR